MQSNIYYVYQLCVEGFDYPFYVGKGQGDRAWQHLTPNKNDRTYKASLIRRAKNDNKNIYVSLMCENMSEHDAHELEKFFVGVWGRKDLGLGPLLNKTDGGEGTSGRVVTEETRYKLSEAQTGKTFSEETKAKMSKSQQGLKLGKSISEKHRLAISAAKQNVSEETRTRMSEAHKGKTIPEEVREKMRASSSKGVSKPVVECPHCGTTGGKGVMQRWHFDNCKHRSVEVV